MIGDYFLFLGISLGINMTMFLLAYKFQTDKLTDISYSLSFIISVGCLYLLRSSKSPIDSILIFLIFLWAIRLGSYLLIRIYAMGRDDRFDKIRISFKSFLAFWTMQAISVSIICIPLIISFNLDSSPISTVNYLGIILSIFGLLIESIADHQKFTYKKENPNKFIQSGLWRRIRHPNYLGEIIFWIGIFFTSFSIMNISIWGIISPIWIIFLLVKFSGIPPLEERWLEKYGQSNMVHYLEFQTYYKKTWRLIPFIY